MLTHPTPKTLCYFELRACKYRFDIENELLYIFQALIYSTHRLKKVQINWNFDQKGRFEKMTTYDVFREKALLTLHVMTEMHIYVRKT